MVFSKLRFKNSKRNIERKHVTVTSAVENYIINKIIRVYPRWVTPDLLTFSAFLIGLLLIPFYYLVNFNVAYIWIVNLLYFLHWVTDATDGNLAYHRKTPRPNYGNYLDHTLDNITLFAVAFGLGLSPIIGMEIAIVGLIIAYLWNLQSAYFGLHEGVLRISSRGLGSTEGRLLVIIMQTYWLYFPGSIVLGYHVVEYGVWAVIAILFFIFIFDFTKNLRYLRAMDDAKLARKKKN